MRLPESKTPFRVWVNQPSLFHPNHELHGQNFLAIHEYGNIFRIYFLSGQVVSQQILSMYLSEGWK